MARSLADTPTLNASGAPGSDIALSWTDGTPAALQRSGDVGRLEERDRLLIERAVVTAGVPGTFEQIGTALANVTSYTDSTTVAGTDYAYRVVAKNAAGEVVSAVVFVPPLAP